MPTARRVGVLPALALLSWLAGCGERVEETGAAALPAAASSPVRAASPAPGVVVWESNRSGDWRLWRSDLYGGDVGRLTDDEPDRRHCCPHISPDGRWVAYLSLPSGRRRYLDEAAVGELRLARLDGAGGRHLVDAARTYFEHRAVVWTSDEELQYIAGDGAVRRLNLTTGRQSQLLAPPADLGRRWIVDASGRWAATGRGALARVVDGRLADSTPLPGCQPYFSHDGRWGFWTAGAGGPIDRFDLETGEAETIVARSDPRLPGDRGYLYFPMISRDGTLFAFAASGGEHDHHRADYDLFVAEIDPGTLELLGDPWPVAPHPAVDRFPDVWRAPLSLGRVHGTVPLTVDLPAPGEEAWQWRLGERALGGGDLRTTVESPGIYPLTARAGGRRLHGVVVAEAPEPEIVWRREWPARLDGALWLWRAAAVPPTTSLGRDADAPLDLAQGPVTARGSAALLHAGMQRTNQFSLELLLTAPPAPPGRDLRAIVGIGRHRSRENLVLGQRGERLVLRMRIGPKGPRAFGETDLGRLESGRPTHLVVTYTPGRTAVYVDGELAARKRDLIGHFFQWRPYALTLGDRTGGGARWSGRLEAVAIYDRRLSPAEIVENVALLSRRPTAARHRGSPG